MVDIHVSIVFFIIHTFTTAWIIYLFYALYPIVFCITLTLLSWLRHFQFTWLLFACDSSKCFSLYLIGYHFFSNIVEPKLHIRSLKFVTSIVLVLTPNFDFQSNKSGRSIKNSSILIAENMFFFVYLNSHFYLLLCKTEPKTSQFFFHRIKSIAFDLASQSLVSIHQTLLKSPFSIWAIRTNLTFFQTT